MRVNKIELLGFKSFGDRTAFNLHPGITCIVGPNGCGKSNVVDAFKWVLGEQSVKSLRGSKMEEVIFAGSDSKKPRGMSEVSLSVSGLGAAENGKDNVTTVTRRLYRSGDSDYLLNRTSCRLRDIRDIFLDTGLEVKSYSILEQDRIAAILSARADERRFVIEEVAGVVKYKVRRHEAQNKLESSRGNLQRVNDIVAEVKRQINSLDRQVRKAERYKRLMEELRTIELKTAKRDHKALSGELEEILRLYGNAREEDSLMRAELSRAEVEMETGRIGLVEEEKALEALQAELQGVEREMAELERALAVSRKEREHLKEHVVRLRGQLDETEQKRRSAEERKKEAAALKSSLAAEIRSLAAEMDEKAEAMRLEREEIQEREKLLDARRRDSFRVSEELGDLKNELHRLASSLDNLREREAGLGRESDELRSHLSETEAAGRELDSSMLGKNNELLGLKEEIRLLHEESGRQRERLEALRSGTYRAREELASASSRLESLKEMVFAESSGDALRDDVNILASIADVIEVPQEYERAIEATLRETVNGFILSSYDEVRPAVDALKAKEMGRTAFIPEGAEGRNPAPALPEGALARASDVVTSSERFSAVARSLLGGVAVVRDLASALRLRDAGMTLVTLEGEVVEPSGAVIAGKSRGVLTLKRQVRELEGEIQGRRARLEKMEEEAEVAQADLSGKENALARMGERAVEAEKELSLLRLRAEKNAEETERANRKLSLIKIEHEEILKERESLSALVAEKEAEIAGHEERKAQAEAGLAGLQEEIARRKSLFEAGSAEAVELRLELNSKKEKLGALEGEEKGIEALLAELAGKEVLINEDMASTGAKIEEGEAEASGKEEALRGLAVSAGGMSEKISSRKDAISGESGRLIEEQRGLRGLRQRIDDSSQKLSEVEVRRAELRVKLENLAANIKNTYGLELDALEADPVTGEEEERLPELKGKIESLGPVSLGSIEEHEELKERYDFLTKQQEDLQKSIAELEEAITRINTTTRKRLREAYEALKVKFGEVFVKLFGGGMAELVLTDERNILETGIDIVAQPPGKKLQNISLLSGGEKSLTALALLFASFLIKPSPLCILDEADAALDEANTYKFAEMLKELSSDIQFIVVTHNRVTMEAANYIYGITMEEPGNSRAISLEMAKA